MLLTTRLLAAVLTWIVAAVVLAVPAAAAEVPVNTEPPRTTGKAVYDTALRAEPGLWEPADVQLTYRWLRDGEPVRGGRERAYRLGLDDLGHRMSVRVTATDIDGDSAQAFSAATDKVVRAPLANRRLPRVDGIRRYGRTLTARPGRWSTEPARVRFQWYRGDRALRGATGTRYRLTPQDVGTRIRVRETATAPGHTTGRVLSARTSPIDHRVGVRRTVTYRVETRGRITANLATFRRLAQQTFADARGWRATGVQFRPVAKGGSFSLVLAAASSVPSFHPICSSMWSCRVGRYVVINQARWQHASPAWNAKGRKLRDYRHMVVNHETGHWLGRGHASCPGRGQLAPVMMQQSKGTDGCRVNPWPTQRELR